MDNQDKKIENEVIVDNDNIENENDIDTMVDDNSLNEEKLDPLPLVWRDGDLVELQVDVDWIPQEEQKKTK